MVPYKLGSIALLSHDSLFEAPVTRLIANKFQSLFKTYKTRSVKWVKWSGKEPGYFWDNDWNWEVGIGLELYNKRNLDRLSLNETVTQRG